MNRMWKIVKSKVKQTYKIKNIRKKNLIAN